MTEEKPKRSQKRVQEHNCFVKFFFLWMCPVIWNGNKRDVEESDLIPPSEKHESEYLGNKLERYWLSEYEKATKKGQKPKLWKAIFRAFWLSYMPSGFLTMGSATARTIQPLLFARLLSYWTVDTDMTKLEAGYYALGMMGLIFVGMMCNHHAQFFVARFGMKVRVACTGLLYRKILRMSQASLGDIAAGKLVNLMSNDVARFEFSFIFLHYFWLIPIQVSVVLYIMYFTTGFQPIVGVFAVLILILPLQAGLTKLTAVMRRRTAKRTDSRIKLMSEIINGIQVIKMYAWELPFQDVVKTAREHEIKAAAKALYVRSSFLGFMLFTERSSLFITILTLVLTGNMITATTIYPVQQYFSIIQANLGLLLPIAIASLSEMFVSCDRIVQLLTMEEREDLQVIPTGNIITPVSFGSNHKVEESDVITPKRYSTTNHEPVQLQNGDPTKSEFIIQVKNATASWTGKDDLTLKNVTMRIRRNKLCAVIGPVGSGKSSFLQLLLKELALSSGSVDVNGSMSYACQESWLFPATVRENILFGLPYDATKYKKVCEVCCLIPDFKQFAYGDLSLVGERGVSLSGGQRARINLARAVYREADIYLLDDPLSAVDANVGRQLFDGCVNGYLAGRTRVLVTHQIHFLKAADFIIVMNEGSIENMGTFDELVKSEKEFTKLLLNDEENYEVDGIEGKQEKRPSLKRLMSAVSVKSNENAEEIEKEQIQAAEERASGNLKWDVFYMYLSSVKSWFTVFLAIMVLVLTQATATTADYWISYWTNTVDGYVQELPAEEEPDPSLQTQIGSLTNGQFLGIHGGLILALITFAGLRIFCFVSMTIRASKNIHDLMFVNLIRAVMRFFNTNPSGRVLNRFSKDMGAMDELLPRSLLETFQMYLSLTSILVLNAVSLPWTLIPTFVLLTIFITLLKWYLNAAQSVKRLEGTNTSQNITELTNNLIEDGRLDNKRFGLFYFLVLTFLLFESANGGSFGSVGLKNHEVSIVQAILSLGLMCVSKSPVFGMITSTLSGMSTIRSSNSQKRLIQTFDEAQNTHSNAFHTFIGGGSTFGLYLDMLCLIYLGTIMSIFIVIEFDQTVQVGSVGLAVSQSLVLTLMLQMAARFTADFLGQMTAVERVLEYTHLPHEENIDEGPTKPGPNWPSEGNIEFENVNLYYDLNEPPVLKNLKFEIKNGWKVGVVGRTGAGKSSLISALFRLTDIEGNIKIDNVDTQGIAKQELRAKISIIPQEPVLFSASLRYNLDPFSIYNDIDIWRALEQVDLKDTITALDNKVSEGGSNFSVGQRQLICLARAILRSNKILVMDEATANVDPQTDALIQKTIRREFESCTVLTIAHRLNTIMDSDRVLVMDGGEIVEFDQPYTLLCDPKSKFSFMVGETGESSKKALFEIAKKKYNESEKTT